MREKVIFLFVVLIFIIHRDVTSMPVTQIPFALANQWQPMVLPDGLEVDQVLDIAVHPQDAYTLFLATTNGLYRSTDAGDSWVQPSKAPLTWINTVVIAPSNWQRLYASGLGLYRSDDGGSSWTAVATPPSLCDLVVAPTDADRLYVRACSGAKTAVYSSVDGGNSWGAPDPTFTDTLDRLVVSPLDPHILIGTTFDTIYHSRDGGSRWQVVPVGVRYFGRPVFDPQPPYSLYVGHWTGLLRSPDGGQTWQESHTEREFTTLIASPFKPRTILGGDDQGNWRIKSEGDSWQAAVWKAPLSLQWLERSLNDNRALYARTSQELWRYFYRAVLVKPYRLYVPVAMRDNASTPSIEAQHALERANWYREQVNVIPLQLYPHITVAAQNHAAYHMFNHDELGAWSNGPHGEVKEMPGYTGVWPSHRLAAADYPWFGGAEVMHFIGDPIASVDGWMSTIYHRAIVIDPSVHYTGYGSGHSEETAVDVMDFGAGPTSVGLWVSALPYPLAYPADGQKGVPTTWSGGESPDPLPPDVPRPVGYPFTLQGVGAALQVDVAEMRDAQKNVIAVHPNPPDCPTFNCYALIAIEPLQSNTTYTVHAEGRVGDVPFNTTWSFTTGKTAYATTASALLTSSWQTPVYYEKQPVPLEQEEAP